MNETYVEKQVRRYRSGSGYHTDDAIYLIANHCDMTRAVNFQEMAEAEKKRTRVFITEFVNTQFYKES